jgi:hypothetical protein
LEKRRGEVPVPLFHVRMMPSEPMTLGNMRAQRPAYSQHRFKESSNNNK